MSKIDPNTGYPCTSDEHYQVLEGLIPPKDKEPTVELFMPFGFEVVDGHVIRMKLGEGRRLPEVQVNNISDWHMDDDDIEAMHNKLMAVAIRSVISHTMGVRVRR